MLSVKLVAKPVILEIFRKHLHFVLNCVYRNYIVIYQSQTITCQKSYFCLLQWNVFKNNEKWFLFHVKSSFCFCDIYTFILTF